MNISVFCSGQVQNSILTASMQEVTNPDTYAVVTLPLQSGRYYRLSLFLGESLAQVKTGISIQEIIQMVCFESEQKFCSGKVNTATRKKEVHPKDRDRYNGKGGSKVRNPGKTEKQMRFKVKTREGAQALWSEQNLRHGPDFLLVCQAHAGRGRPWCCQNWCHAGGNCEMCHSVIPVLATRSNQIRSTLVSRDPENYSFLCH